MTFLERKNELIKEIQNSNEYSNDLALKRIIQILNNINTKLQLKKEKSLINRISIDSVINTSTVEKILLFTDNHS